MLVALSVWAAMAQVAGGGASGSGVDTFERWVNQPRAAVTFRLTVEGRPALLRGRFVREGTARMRIDLVDGGERWSYRQVGSRALLLADHTGEYEPYDFLRGLMIPEMLGGMRLGIPTFLMAPNLGTLFPGKPWTREANGAWMNTDDVGGQFRIWLSEDGRPTRVDADTEMPDGTVILRRWVFEADTGAVEFGVDPIEGYVPMSLPGFAPPLSTGDKVSGLEAIESPHWRMVLVTSEGDPMQAEDVQAVRAWRERFVGMGLKVHAVTLSGASPWPNATSDAQRVMVEKNYLDLTPALILLGPDSRVKMVWKGLRAADEGLIFRLVRERFVP